MKITLAHISPTRKPAKSPHAEALTQDYLTRASRLNPAQTEIASLAFPSEAALFAHADRLASRTPVQFILFDPQGALPTSEKFAATLGQLRDSGTQHLFLAIGPADGWSPAALARAHATISFGRLTLPHSLARVLAAEQLYRALTILANHPYHLGH